MLDIAKPMTAFCDWPFTQLKVNCEGSVTMCCFQERECLGNILETSLEDIWFGELAENVRKDILNRRFHATCTYTGTCPYRFSNLEDKSFERKLYPTQFEIDLPSQHCNIGGLKPSEKNPACIMCERHRNTWQEFWQEDRLEEVCAKLKPYIKNISLLHIQGISEPFWKERIFELLDWLGVNQYKQQIDVSTTTNGTLMTKERRQRFFQYPKSTIVWSLDASTPEVYRAIRRVDMYDRIVENLKAYAKERVPGQALQIHNNINTLNINDVEGMVELAAEVGVDRLDFNPTYNTPDICVNESNVHLFKEAQEKIVRLSNRLGVNCTFMRDFGLNFEPELHQISTQL